VLGSLLTLMAHMTGRSTASKQVEWLLMHIKTIIAGTANFCPEFQRVVMKIPSQISYKTRMSLKKMNLDDC